MKGALVWFSGAAAAFFLTAAAFLLLANLGSNVSESSLAPRPADPTPDPPLQLSLPEDRLAALEPLPDQGFRLEVRNASTEPFSKVNLTLRVLPADTSIPEARYYRATVNDLQAGDSETIQFRADLSPPEAPRQTDMSSPGDSERVVLEVQATTPEGVSAVRTAILPF